MTCPGDEGVQEISPQVSGGSQAAPFNASLGENWPFNQQLRDSLEARGKTMNWRFYAAEGSESNKSLKGEMIFTFQSSTCLEVVQERKM